MSQASAHSLVGSIVERFPNSSSLAPPKHLNAVAKTGFPPAQHRSKSVFSKSRKDSEGSGSTTASASASFSSPLANVSLPSAHTSDWRSQIHEENERRVAGMTEEEHARARAAILDHFGDGIGDVLNKVRGLRERREQEESRAQESAEKAQGGSTSEPQDLKEGARQC
jgi:RNA polymerase II-associated protein 1